MTQEIVPESVPYDDNMRITAVAKGVNAKSAAVLAAGTDLTYSLKAFNRTQTEAVIEDERLTLKQVLQRAGKLSENVEVQFVFGDDEDVAAPLLLNKSEHQIAVRYSTPNATEWTAAQVADVIHIRCGIQRKDAPVTNGVQTITQTWFITKVSEPDIAIVA